MWDRFDVLTGVCRAPRSVQHFEALVVGLMGQLKKLDNGILLWGSTRPNLEQKLIRVATECPEAFARKYSVENSAPCYPLSIICGVGCSLEAVASIHDAYPQAIFERDDEKLLPIQKAVECAVTPNNVIHYLMKAHPESLAHTDSNGALLRQTTPLHIACSNFLPSMEENELRRLSVRRILDLLAACPAAAMAMDCSTTGYFPLATLIDKESNEGIPPELIDAFLKAAPFSFTMLFKPKYVGKHHTTPQSVLLRRKDTPNSTFRALLLVGNPNHFNSRTWGLLSLERKLLVVEVFVSFTFELDPSYTSNYPLHSIILCPLSPSEFNEFLHHFKNELERPDDKGRLPLHVAVASERVRFDRISRIAESDPLAASCVDPETGLFPLEAVASRTNARHETALLEHLDSLYRLLRSDPGKIMKELTCY